ncbi:FmdB family zinc ribbon protein [Azoarcus sp. KH32C]|uniref:FmdB family zinc ribbon protein n=1 Tax=Azoarcus sp. KH32C TaxID=748247 RepID=UPI0002386061|nr:zinc ribbon domain-containing protein [Azoarcus sp. KH32C]BAL25652.1 hypothetical protein AZKH_3363 [Azoarcus sp. KH32C]
MPTYEYRCKDCGHVFDLVEHVAEHAESHPVCPQCQSRQIEPVPMPAFLKTSKKS